MAELPPRAEVAPVVSPAEAFARATETYERWITTNTHPESREVVAEIESLLFRPSTELLLAGLNFLSGQDFPPPMNRTVALACFAADHLLWGWFCAVICHPRVSLTLSRAAAEASIFAVYSVSSPKEFREVWGSRKGTGGAVLPELRNIPPQLHRHLRAAWLITAPFGHASPVPVTSALTSFRDGTRTGLGLAIGGQFAGPMDAAVLHNLGNAYSLVSIASVEAMDFCLSGELEAFPAWQERFSELQERLQMRVPVPSYLEEHLPELRARLKKMGIE